MWFESLVRVLFVMLGAYALWTARYKPHRVPLLLAATLPCSNFLIDWYVQWSPGKVVLVASALVLPFHISRDPELSSLLKLPRGLKKFLVVQLVLTVIIYLLFQRNLVDPGLDMTRGARFRPIVQLVSEWLRVGALLTVVGWVRDRETVLRIFKVLLVVTTAAALYGIYQFVGYYAGLPITGIARAQAGYSGQHAVTQIAGVDLFRVGSFVGEPKHLAEWLIPSIVFIICTKVFPSLAVRSRLTSYPVLLLHIVTLVLTFATSSYLGVCLGLLPIAWLFRGSSTNLVRVATVAGIIVVAGLVLTSAVGVELSREIFLERTVDRFDLAEPSLVIDTAAVQFLIDHPAYLLTGVGVGNASFHIDEYVPDWVGGQFDNPVPLSISSMYLLFLIEGGIPVLLLFLVFLGGAVFKAREIALAARSEAGEALVLTSAAICCMVAVLGGFYSSEEDGMLWLYWGLLIAVCGIVGSGRAREVEPGGLRLGAGAQGADTVSLGDAFSA